ncbi:MAG: hypothetical protein JWO51_3651 [Rhodospirillales bacterium]|nr:hypothetical protein [Rhodospirillales bacterium]
MSAVDQDKNSYTTLPVATFGDRARGLFHRLFSRWVSMASHSDTEVFRLGL